MEIKELQERVDAWIREYGVRYFSELTNMACLTEEVGELARVMARKYGDQSFKAGEKENLADEMADVLWVLVCLANQTGVDLTAARSAIGASLSARRTTSICARSASESFSRSAATSRSRSPTVTGRPLKRIFPPEEICTVTVGRSGSPAAGRGVLTVKLQSIIIAATTGMAAPSRSTAKRRFLNWVIMANRFLVSE